MKILMMTMMVFLTVWINVQQENSVGSRLEFDQDFDSDGCRDSDEDNDDDNDGILDSVILAKKGICLTKALRRVIMIWMML